MRERQVAGIVILTPKDNLWSDRSVDELVWTIQGAIKNGNRMLVVNLLQTQAISSIGFSVLVRAWADYRRQGGSLRLCCSNSEIIKDLVMLKLCPIIDHYPTEAAAIASFSQPSTSVMS